MLQGQQIRSNENGMLRRPRATTLIAFLMLFGNLAPLGCLSVTAYVSPEYVEMVREPAFQADHPIAKEVRYTYVRMQFKDGNVEGKPRVTTNEEPFVASATIPAAILKAPAHVGPRMSDIYSERAGEAQRRGNLSAALSYRQSSVTMAEVETSMDNMVSTANNLMAGYLGVLGALNALADLIALKTANDATGWAVENTRSIGESAPDGSVLHLDFRETYEYGTRKMHLGESDWTWIVTATLERGHAETLQSRRAFEMSARKDDSSTPLRSELTPLEGNVLPDYVPADKWNVSYFALMANSAIRELYEKLAAVD